MRLEAVKQSDRQIVEEISMLFGRFAGLKLGNKVNLPRGHVFGWNSCEIQVVPIEYSKESTDGSTERESTSSEPFRLFLGATTRMDEWPEILADGEILVPNDVRSRSEEAIEMAANIIAVMGHCSKEMNSALPPFAFIPECEDDQTYLAAAKYTDNNSDLVFTDKGVLDEMSQKS